MQPGFILPPLALAVSACASAQNAAPAASVPDNLKPSANEAVAMVFAAKGVQICSRATAGTVARVPYTADYYLLAANDDVQALRATASPVGPSRSSYSY